LGGIVILLQMVLVMHQLQLAAAGTSLNPKMVFVA